MEEVQVSAETSIEELWPVVKYVKEHLPDINHKDFKHTVTTLGKGRVRVTWSARSLAGHAHVLTAANNLRNFVANQKECSVKLITTTTI